MHKILDLLLLLVIYDCCSLATEVVSGGAFPRKYFGVSGVGGLASGRCVLLIWIALLKVRGRVQDGIRHVVEKTGSGAR